MIGRIVIGLTVLFVLIIVILVIIQLFKLFGAWSLLVIAAIMFMIIISFRRRREY